MPIIGAGNKKIKTRQAGNFEGSQGSSGSSAPPTSAPQGYDAAGNAVVGSLGGRNVITGGSSGRRSPINRSITEPSQSPAAAYLDTFQAPESVAQIAERKRKEARGMIDELKLLYRDERDTIEARRRERLAETNALSVNSGLAGGPRAFAARSDVNVASDKELKAARDQNEAKLKQVYAQISRDAQEEARFQRQEARQSAEGIVKRDEARQAKARENVQLLAASGVDFDKFKSSPGSQAAYQYALQTFDGNETAMRAFFTLNRPVEQVKERKFENGQLIQIWENPVSGNQRIEVTNLEELGLKIPRGYSEAIDLGGQVMLVPKDFDPSKDTPFYINKSLTPAQAADAAGGGGAGGQDGIYDILDFRTANAVIAQSDKFQSSPVVTRYNAALEARNVIAGFDPNTQNPADHQAVVYAFAKALDPESVVREGEYETIKKYAQSLPTRYKGEINNALTGNGFLSPGAISAIQQTVENRYQSQFKQYTNLKNEYARKIDQLAGQPVSGMVLLDNEGGYEQSGDPEEEAAAAAPVGAEVTIGGQAYVKVGDDQYEPAGSLMSRR